MVVGIDEVVDADAADSLRDAFTVTVVDVRHSTIVQRREAVFEVVLVAVAV